MSWISKLLATQNAGKGTVLIDSSTPLVKSISGFLAIEDLTIATLTSDGPFADLTTKTIPAGVYVPGYYTAMTVSSGTAIGVIRE